MSDSEKTKDQIIAELRQQLEDQNHRLSLQVAVQRVHVEAATMRQSGDLGKVMLALWNGLVESGLRFERGSLNIVDLEAGTWQCYLMAPLPEELVEAYRSTPYFYQADVASGIHLMRSELLPLEFSQEYGHANPYMEPSFWVAPENFPAQLEQMWGGPVPDSQQLIGRHGMDVPFSHGGIWCAAMEGESFDQDDMEIALQFSDAVDLGYTRFLDLQAAEERNRQLLIERAAESLRAEAMAMHQTSDIALLMAALCRNLETVGLAFDTCLISLTDEELDVLRLYAAMESDYEALIQSGFPIERILQKDLADDMQLVVTDVPLPFARENGYAMSGFEPRIIVQPDSFRDEMKAIWSWPGAPEGLAGSYGLNVPFDYGGIYICGLRGTVYTDPDLKLVEQFAEAVSLGYTRYFDIRTAEEAQRKLIADLEEELQTAHDMQMNLMPERPPEIPGLDIAGRCLTANHVGGDFFQFFPHNGKLAITLADVTGHAMEAAIPAVLFSGILDNQMESGASLEQLFSRLNRSMHRNLDSRTFVYFAAAELDLASRAVRLANGGCPYPYHYRSATNDIVELQVEAYPLGVQPDVSYPILDATLSPGDRLIFCSDGIVEATDTTDDLFGFERTATAILDGCRQNLSAADLIEHLFARLKGFTGDVSQGDDQTVVVVNVEP